VVTELSKIQLYSASIDPQALKDCLDKLSSEYGEYGSDIFEGILKKITTTSTHITSSIQIINDFDKTIERIHPPNHPSNSQSNSLPNPPGSTAPATSKQQNKSTQI
jgi:hypothetical protein